jgi:hypothetical protein
MDPILALIGDLYSQVTALQQQSAHLAEQLALVTEARDQLAEATKAKAAK